MIVLFSKIWRTIILTSLLSLIFAQAVFAGGNVTSAFASVDTTVDAFYFSDQYLWKVSIYVAKDSATNEATTLSGAINMDNFDDYYYQIGDDPMYLLPDNNAAADQYWYCGQRPSSLAGIYMSRSEGKLDTIADYQSGGINAVSAVPFSTWADTPMTVMPNLPYVPNMCEGNVWDNGTIVSSTIGNIETVRTYFEDPDMIQLMVDAYAARAGTTSEALVSGKEFTINGITRSDWNTKAILPSSWNGNTVNCVSWLLVYEPVTIVYVKDNASTETDWDKKDGTYFGYGMTATDFSVSQLKQQIDWCYDETRWTAWTGHQPDAFRPNSQRQHVQRLSNLLLGNAVFLDQSWFGLTTSSGVDETASPINLTRWTNSAQILSGGVGMQQSTLPKEYVDPSSFEFRPDTDVIVTCPVYFNTNSKEELNNGNATYIDVTYMFNYIDKNGNVCNDTVTDTLIAGAQTQTQSYVKWHTPDYDLATTLTCTVSVELQYPLATVNGGLYYADINIKITPLTENVPPNPAVDDTAEAFGYDSSSLSDLDDAITTPDTPESENLVEDEIPVSDIAEIYQVTRLSDETVYLGDVVRYEVITNLDTQTINFIDGNNPARKLTPDKIGVSILMDYEKDETNGIIRWTITFIPSVHGTNTYTLIPVCDDTGEGQSKTLDVFVDLDPDNPIIYDVWMTPDQEIYRLYNDIVTTPLSHTVSFHTDGGTIIDSQSIVNGGKVANPGVVSKLGYEFKGWYTDKNYFDEWDFDTRSVTKTMTLYAKWDVQTYEVIFEGNGATISPPLVVVSYGESVEQPSDVTRENYTFGGWFKDAAFTTAYHFNSDVITEDLVLYAKWIANDYIIKFESNGGSAVSDLYVDYNTLAIIPTDPVRVGYIFQGWFKDVALTEAFDWSSEYVISNFNLYAKWKAETYTVTFEGLNGETLSVLSTVEYNTLLSQPVDPDKLGYTFEGWFKDELLSDSFNFVTDRITGDTVIYAKFVANDVVISFEANGGSVVDDYKGVANQLILDTLMPQSSLDNFVFNGWHLLSDCSDSAVFNYPSRFPLEDVQYYAAWAPATCAVLFDEAGGSSVGTQVVSYGSLLSEPICTKSGYVLVGWFTDLTFTNEWDFATDTISEFTHLYAKWE